MGDIRLNAFLCPCGASMLVLASIAVPILAAQQPTLLRNATLIDGTGGAPRLHVDILLRNGLIESVKPSDAAGHGCANPAPAN